MKSVKFLLIFAIVAEVISSCQFQPGDVPMTPLPPGAIASPTTIGAEISTPTLVKNMPVVSTESCVSHNGPLPSLVNPEPEITGVDLTRQVRGSLGGGVVQSKEFTIELILYCDSAYGPTSMEPYFLSDIDGLAINHNWRYDGTVENGPTYVFFGMPSDIHQHKEPGDSLRPGQINSGYSDGITFGAKGFPFADLSMAVSVRFLYILRGPSGQLSGATLSFDLRQVSDGIQPGNVSITALSDAELESLKSTLPPVTP